MKDFVAAVATGGADIMGYTPSPALSSLCYVGFPSC